MYLAEKPRDVLGNDPNAAEFQVDDMKLGSALSPLGSAHQHIKPVKVAVHQDQPRARVPHEGWAFPQHVELSPYVLRLLVLLAQARQHPIELPRGVAQMGTTRIALSAYTGSWCIRPSNAPIATARLVSFIVTSKVSSKGTMACPSEASTAGPSPALPTARVYCTSVDGGT